MNKIVNIKIEHIHPHPENPRKELGDLSEIAESIKKNGIMQNLTVIPIEGELGEYRTIIGHRRHAAAKLAGLMEVPCRVIEGMSEKEQLSTMLEENMQRSDLTIYEQAQGFQMMLNLGETEETIAEKTGFSKTTIRHRLNIARLDQKVLKNKEKDASFQLTLKDLCELEKVEDIKIRNKILKEAKNSREIIWKAQNAANEAKRKKKEKQIIDILSKLGLKRAPKEAEREQYTGKWETVKEFDLEKDIPKQIKLKGTETLCYLSWYRKVLVIKNAKKEKKILTPEEVERKQRDKNKKIIRAELKALDATRKEFIQNIISGKINAVKNESEIKEKIWKVLIEGNFYLSQTGMRTFFTGKSDCECTPEEIAEAKQRINNLSFIHSMLVTMHIVIENIGDSFDWNGYYDSGIGRRMMNAYEVLRQYGWTFEDDNNVKLLNGTHELYVKRKDEKKTP